MFLFRFSGTGTWRITSALAAAVCAASLAGAWIDGSAPAAGRYRLILWSTGAPASPQEWPARVREAGYETVPISRGMTASPGIGYYVENIVPELAFHHARKPLYEADRAAYGATWDKRRLARQPCFDDPGLWEGLAARVTDEVRGRAGLHPQLYDLRDEPSIGAYSAPMDYCFCPHTLRAFRAWLKTRYGSLEALNAEWETRFASWEQAAPMTTFEIKARERAELAEGRPENYAPWADHREYMDASFAAAIARLRGIVRAADPDALVGIEGTQIASAWGGYDLWRLARAIDWVEPYDLGNSRAMFGSFLPPEAPILYTYNGSQPELLRREIWARLLDGDSGAILWDDGDDRVIDKFAPGMPLTAKGKAMRDVFAEIAPAAAKLAGRRRAGDGIAIHYSQASIRAHWMFDSREDGDRWLDRLPVYDRENSRLAKSRDSFVKVVEDLGYNPDFVSYEQIENGELTRGYRVLLLPQSVALSAAESRNIEAFARAGGVVIADNMAGGMDEHGRRLPAGRLDALFGIRGQGGWRPGGSGPAAPSAIDGAAPLWTFDSRLQLAGGRRDVLPGAPMVVRNGSAYYLNLDMRPYRELRERWPRGANYTALFRAIFSAAGLQPQVAVTGAHDVLARRYAAPGVEYVALIRNRKTRETPGGGAPVRIHVTLPRTARVTAGGRDLGVARELDLELDPWLPSILELRTP